MQRVLPLSLTKYTQSQQIINTHKHMHVHAQTYIGSGSEKREEEYKSKLYFPQTAAPAHKQS